MAAIGTSEVQALVQWLGTALAPSTVEVIDGRVAVAVRDRIVTTSPCVERPQAGQAAGLDA